MHATRTTVQLVEVGPEENGRKLTTFLEARLGSLPSGLLMRLVRTGQVRIDGRRCKPFDRVATGQQVRIPPVTVEVASRDTRTLPGLVIVHQDQDMLLVHKPSGLPVHPGTGWNDSVHDRLKSLFPGQVFTPTPVHRLDRDTSGLLLCARTHDFLRSMHALWPTVTKAYLCWVDGVWSLPGWQSIVSDLGKTKTRQGERVVSGQGKRAVSHVRLLTARGNSSLLVVVLGTGRTHQIRVHLADQGHPIVGDPKYGRGQGLRLHAAALSWPGHRYFLPPAWEGDFQMPHDLNQSITTMLASAPAKEGAV
jgi:23S rRNA pseudouridine955/2504/2580 synthase